MASGRQSAGWKSACWMVAGTAVGLTLAAAPPACAQAGGSPSAASGTPSSSNPANQLEGAVQSQVGAFTAQKGAKSAPPPTPAATAIDLKGSLQSQIDAFIAQLGLSSRGALRWDGSDPYQVTKDGSASVAIITHARLSIPKSGAQLALDRIEIRETPDASDAKLVDLALVLPKTVTLSVHGQQFVLTLDNGKGSVTLSAQSGRAQQSEMTLDGARIDHKTSGSWITLGPVKLSSNLVHGTGTSWTAPFIVDIAKVAFFSTTAPFSAALARLSYTGSTAGPDIDKLEKFRDRIGAVNGTGANVTPDERLATMLDLLPGLPDVFSKAEGKLELAGLTVRIPTGTPLVSFDTASLGGQIGGLDGKETTLRIEAGEDGLALAPSILDPSKVPHHVIIDFGFEHINTDALRSLLVAMGGMDLAHNDPAKRAVATQQMLGAAAMLNPTFHIYDIDADTKAVGVQINAQAQGSPLSPQGYSATGDVLVEGFDAIAALATGNPLTSYLPLLKVMAKPATTKDGVPGLGFALSSAPGKWLTINGNDVSDWIINPPAAPPGEPRLLRLQQPPLFGPDVTRVQGALGAAEIPVVQVGVYNAETAVAVARFQQEHGLNVDGDVDAATRAALKLTGASPPADLPAPPPAQPPVPPPVQRN